MFGHRLLTLAAVALAHPPAALAADAALETTITGLLVGTSDYVWRGVSQREEKPSVIAQLAITHGLLFSEISILGLDLGHDALGRSIGNKELDVRVGVAPSFGPLELSLGVQLYMFPGGRDLIEETLDAAERDFQELFLSASLPLNEKLSLGASIMWSPDFYYETGKVTTGEVEAAWVLPEIGPATSRFTTILGHSWSEEPDVVGPGSGYTYYNAGLEMTIEKLIFDLRYWGTTVDDDENYADRVVLSAAVVLD